MGTWLGWCGDERRYFIYHAFCPPVLLITSILTSIHLWNWHFNCIQGNSAQAIRLNYCSGRRNSVTQSVVLHMLVSAEKVWCFQSNAETEIRPIYQLWWNFVIVITVDDTVICDCECFKWYCQKILKEILWSTDSTKQIRQLIGLPLSKYFTKNYKLLQQDMHTHSKLLGGVMTTLFSVKLYHHHLLLDNLLAWACVKMF